MLSEKLIKSSKSQKFILFFVTNILGFMFAGTKGVVSANETSTKKIKTSEVVNTVKSNTSANTQSINKRVSEYKEEEARKLAAKKEEEAKAKELADKQSATTNNSQAQPGQEFNGGLFKSYMDYQCINVNSTQRYIIDNYTTVGEDGLLRADDGAIGVAMGSYFGNLGNRFIIKTDTGQTFKVIKVEAKADCDTTGGIYDRSGGIIEFVIDTNAASNAYPNAIFQGSFNAVPQYSGNIISITAY